MSKSSEKRFEEIADTVISDMEAVSCSFAGFVEGLRGLEAQVRDRRIDAEKELQGMEEEDLGNAAGEDDEDE